MTPAKKRALLAVIVACALGACLTSGSPVADGYDDVDPAGRETRWRPSGEAEPVP